MDVYLNYGLDNSKDLHKKLRWFYERRFEVGTEGKIWISGKIQGAVVIDLLKMLDLELLIQFKFQPGQSAPGKCSTKEDNTEIYDLLKEYSAVGFDKSKKESNIKSYCQKQEKSYRYSKLMPILDFWIKEKWRSRHGDERNLSLCIISI